MFRSCNKVMCVPEHKLALEHGGVIGSCMDILGKLNVMFRCCSKVVCVPKHKLALEHGGYFR